MLTITADEMYKAATDHHTAEAIEVRDEVERLIRRAASAGLTTTTVAMLHNDHPLSDKARAMLIGWIKDAGFEIYSDPDEPPCSLQILWGRAAA
ncbi:hypothetical protein CC426_18960 [Salmonella enterica subsp. enterica serovar Newport]|nr:hypothetical protein [Salmonella enterica subsp. enterica serovar Indiana]ECE9837781.1 hypothetical protein [Salmonella enterica subsp. enterica serovar Kentucky]EDH9275676.1 hypothetical protein [Salmonella enterica subsp. enterica serovar Newport]MDJ8383591.1 hypothetical protein [Salmonella enterica]QMV34336.1 hypothetical protein [Salmonella phage vB_SentM_sal2]QMV34415.1 hypothetical protein [Salmonella phage vB_SentM_sal3]UTQ78944.1 hypothetical protein [Salmonella phage PST-H4]WOZ1